MHSPHPSHFHEAPPEPATVSSPSHPAVDASRPFGAHLRLSWWKPLVLILVLPLVLVVTQVLAYQLVGVIEGSADPMSPELTPSKSLALNLSIGSTGLVAVLLLLLPLYSVLSGNIFVLTLFTRIVIFALAAASLNLIMGYGGMMSFGHAAYLGIGGYAVGILAFEGIGSGFIQWPVALAASALFALVIGALSRRTRGVYFIMITLAFAQRAYYVASGLAGHGERDNPR